MKNNEFKPFVVPNLGNSLQSDPHELKFFNDFLSRSIKLFETSYCSTFRPALGQKFRQYGALNYLLVLGEKATKLTTFLNIPPRNKIKAKMV